MYVGDISGFEISICRVSSLALRDDPRKSFLVENLRARLDPEPEVAVEVVVDVEDCCGSRLGVTGSGVGRGYTCGLVQERMYKGRGKGNYSFSMSFENWNEFFFEFVHLIVHPLDFEF